jgi:metallophosphoesterase superfamily enzyme
MPVRTSVTPIPDLPILLLERGERTIVAGDVHLGYEDAMAGEGIHLPPGKEDPADVLARAALDTGASKIVLLGDVKHRIPRPSTGEGFGLKEFFRRLLDVVDGVDVCPGNHDGGLADALTAGVTLPGPKGFADGGVGFFLGHTWPDPHLLGMKFLLMGHSHPHVWFTDPLKTRDSEPCWLRAEVSPRRIFDEGVARGIYPDPKKAGKRDGQISTAEGKGRTGGPVRRPGPKKRTELLVVPAVSPFGSGFPVNHVTRPLLGPLGTGSIIDPARTRVYLLNSVHLGALEDLPPVNNLPPFRPHVNHFRRSRGSSAGHRQGSGTRGRVPGKEEVDGGDGD